VQRADKTAETRNRLVPGGTIDHCTAAITTAQGFGQSEKGGGRGVKTVAFENIFRKASVVLVAGAYGLWSYHAITRHLPEFSLCHDASVSFAK
jgi:hypothetical protein